MPFDTRPPHGGIVLLDMIDDPGCKERGGWERGYGLDRLEGKGQTGAQGLGLGVGYEGLFMAGSIWATFESMWETRNASARTMLAVRSQARLEGKRGGTGSLPDRTLAPIMPRRYDKAGVCALVFIAHRK